MPLLLIRHNVADVETWRHWFAAETGTRYAHGARLERVFRNVDDPSEIWLLIEWDDLFRARLFVTSDDLDAAIDQAGVADWPDHWFLEGDDPL